jgi:hypothetical protein
MRKTAFTLLAVFAIAAAASAQQASTYTFERKATGDAPQRVVLDKVVAEQGLKIAVERRAVTNAPYSAEAVNESIQLLPDGNRIVHRTTTRVYRDSAGRTRRETLDENGQVTLVTINDPAAGTAFVSDPRNNTVSTSTMRMRTSGDQAAGGGGVVVAGQPSGTATTFQVFTDKQGQKVMEQQIGHATEVAGAAGGMIFVSGAPLNGETTKEDLGQQSIEGVSAKGTRTTTTIPAGTIGNDQPIKIVSEEWTSPDLQVLVMTKHSDPRTGETTYRLTGITRAEPAAALFEPPAKKN